jgi:Na+-transporting methylmalonyl-CoA/oxaloacetate decarboxylase gamma subunit
MSLIASIGAFLPGLLGKELPYKTARIAGFITLAILATIMLSLGKCAYDASVVADHEQKREIAAGEAREVAADQRVEDAIINAQKEEELNNVIEAAPGGELSPAARALACERLRRIGRVPPACGPESRDGAEAGPR